MLSGALSGTGALTKNGSGTLTLSGANTRTKATNLAAGTLVAANAKAFGIGALNLKGGTLATSGGDHVFVNAVKLVSDSTLANSGNITFTKNFTNYTDSTLTANGSGSLILAGRVSLSNTATSRTLTLAGPGNIVISSSIVNGGNSTAGNILKSGAGVLTFSGSVANIHAGSTTITGGTLLLGKNGVNAIAGNLIIGDTSGADFVRLLGNQQISDTSELTINSAGVLELNGFSETVGGISGAGRIDLGSGELAIAGTAARTFSGMIAGPGNLVKTGAGTLTLGNAANSFGGLRVENGSILLGAAGAISSASTVTVSGASSILDSGNFDNSAAGLVLEGGRVQTNTGAFTLGGDVAATSLDTASAVISGKLALGTAVRTFDVTEGAGGAATDLAISAAISGAGGLVKTGDGILLLSGTNSFTGPASVSAGVLRISGGSAISDAAAVTLSGGMLDLAAAETIGSLAGGGNVQLGGTLSTGGTNASTTYAGGISGSGGLTKTGAGVFTLAGASTYTGATAVSGGILRAGSDSALAATSAFAVAAGSALDLDSRSVAIGSLAGGGNVTLGSGALAIGGNGGSAIFSGSISGSGGAIRKTGAGTLTLTGNNTPGGALTISGGKILLSGTGRISSATSASLQSGGTLALDNASANDSDRIANPTSLVLDGGTLQFVANSAGTSESLGSLSLASGNSAVSLTQTSGPAILNFASLGTLASGATVSFSASGGTLGASASAPQVYIGGLASGFIGGWATVGADFAEYSTFGVRGITGYYGGADGINVNDANQIPILASTSLASATTLTRAGATIDKALNLQDIAVVNLNSDSSRVLNLASGGIVKSTSTATTISGAGRLTAGGTSAGTLAATVSSGSALTISSSIIDNSGGSVSLSKAGAGILTLSGTNSYTGGNSVSEGTLAVSSEANLGALANGIAFNGGALKLTSGIIASAGKIFTVSSGLSGTLDIASGQNLTLANSANRLVSGNAASMLYLTGPGSLVLQGANTGFTGTVQANAGTLELRNVQSLGGGIILAGGNLKLATATGTNFSNALTARANATIDLAAAAAHSLASLSIGASTLTINGSGGSSLAFGATTLTGDATFSTATAGITLGSVSGAFGFRKSGAGTLTLAGAGTYTGAAFIDAGILKLAAANATSAVSALTLASDTTFDLANFSTVTGSLAGSGNVTLGSGTLTTGANDASTTWSGVISGAGGLTKSGAGVLTFAGANTYTGATSIARGILQLGAAERISNSSAVAISGGATLNLANFSETIGSLAGAGTVSLGSGNLATGGNGSSTTFSGVVSGTGNLTKSGSGTLTLAGANTFSGVTAVTSGVLNLRNSAALGATTSGTNVSAGAAIELQGNLAIGAEALSLKGSGIGGAGALRNVSGENSWAGNVTLAEASAIGSDSGTLILGGAVTTATNLLTLTGAGTTQLDGVVSGTAGLAKGGAGTAVLSGANTFSGDFQINAGTVIVQNAKALGTTGPSSGTMVAAGATLQLDDDAGLKISGELLTLNGPGALSSSSGDNEWTGGITLASNSGVAVLDDTLSLSGVVSGPGQLVKTGSGDLLLTAANSYTGATLVNQGRLVLSGSLASTSVTVASGASFSASGDISTNTALIADGSVELTGRDRTIASLNGSGSLVLNGSNLTVGSGHFSGIITDSDAASATKPSGGSLAQILTDAPGGSLTKTTGGVLTLDGDGYQTGPTKILAGTLQLFGNHSTNSVTIASGATFTGSGSVAGSLNYDSGSIFQWDIAPDGGNGTYNKFTSGSISGSGAIFQIVLGSGSFGDAFWDTPRTWSDVITSQSGATLASIFTGGFGGSVPASGVVPGQGTFSFSGNDLSWSAVPEPSGAIAGIWIAHGLLRRRRPQAP